MTKTKLAMMLGVAAQLGLSGVAMADGWTASALKVYAADPQDLARVANGRLRKTRNEETQEMAQVVMLDGVNGLYFMKQTGRNSAGVLPKDDTQGSCTPFKLVQDASGNVTAQVTGDNVFVTNNVGQNERNFNLPFAYPINGGKAALLTYNYRPNNNTERYAIVVDAQCHLVPVQDANGNTKTQVKIMAKNNDDCDMSQAGEGAGIVQDAADGSSHLTYWAGCNGNGRDDGWVNDVSIIPVNNGAAYKIVKNFDVDVEPQEERSRGRCSIGTDPNTAICTWTAGNNQPQRDGTWIGAIDISANGEKGESAQSRLLWKKMIQGQKKIDGIRTYSVRANSSRVLDPATGKPTDDLFVQVSDLRGNNTNNRKGGRYLRMYLGVAHATKDGLTWTVEPTDVTDMMLGIDATHLVESAALIQDNGKVVPAMTYVAGSQFGGSAVRGADFKVLGYDAASKKFVDYGTHALAATFDRHLYSNYLGQNPGNQGRNYADSHMIVNPFQTGAKYLMLSALTGKASEDVANPAIKTSGFLSIMALQNPTVTPPPPPGMPNTKDVGQTGSGGGQNATPQPGDPTPANEVPASPGSAGTPGSFSSGCSMAAGHTNASGIFFLLAGLALVGFVRRRRA